ncbi:helix-turn-helix domain-containing protein [Bradyrhizobium betae]|uniref:Helix-turn-helix domain-containing protein n=1 Tax=Bradyrhizobium betae TaxID=244734 RepID=A0A5P6NZF7_9BRAD|nr:helix-turn-helix domain-containing protein [Bradyrhizobium betae]MCS3725166.1 AraC family ethanolamine operon transcriptional activator [Bradyrhizobium betae]QFI71499.1 helix-turn-helix domain-containing protein [Bradyrhizobium betae]
MPLARLKPSRVLGIERFTDFGEFRANEVLGLATSTPLRPREFSLTRAILPLQNGLFVLQRAFARQLELDVGTDQGMGLVVPFSFHSLYNGREIDNSTVSVVRGRVPIKSVEPQPNTYLMMRFNSDMRHRGWADYDSGLGFFRTHDAPMARLRATILNMFCLASEHGEPRQFEAINRPIQETLLDCLDAALVPADGLAARRGSFDKHRKLIARLDEIVALFGSKPLYSDDLARALGVSVRTLQTATHAVHGVSLHHYLRLKRLWSTRIQLMTGGAGLSVKAAALGNGFWHLGDFSRGYKMTFGEAPSETLARGRRL